MFTLTALDMRVCGKTISSTEGAKKVGPMAQFILANILQVKSMEEESIAGTTVVNTTASGSKIRLKALALTPG